MDPPIKQGQTRYPFLITQFEKDEEIDVKLQLNESVHFVLFVVSFLFSFFFPILVSIHKVSVLNQYVVNGLNPGISVVWLVWSSG